MAKGPSEERVIQEIIIVFNQKILGMKSSIESKLKQLKLDFEEMRKIGMNAEIDVQQLNISRELNSSIDKYYELDGKIQSKVITGSNDQEREMVTQCLEKVLENINKEKQRCGELEVETRAAH